MAHFFSMMDLLLIVMPFLGMASALLETFFTKRHSPTFLTWVMVAFGFVWLGARMCVYAGYHPASFTYSIIGIIMGVLFLFYIDGTLKLNNN